MKKILFVIKSLLSSFDNGIILYFASSHGLGNNLIEISVLKSLYPDQLLFAFTPCVGLEILDTKMVYVNYKWSIKNRLIMIFLKRIFLTFSKLRIISLIYENFEKHAGYIIKKEYGFFRKISLVRFNSYFQIVRYLDKLNLTISDIRYENEIKKITHFNKELESIDWEQTCFLHIRRGDYIQYPDKELPAILDLSWYLKAIKMLESKYKIKNYIVCSNDIFYIRDTLAFDKRNIIFHSNVIEELCIMAKCRYGILSASSLSWCAAKLSKKKYKSNNFFIAPKYWIGHRRKKWIPFQFEFKWINYL